jgi:NTP pyrophosphatase (non-canonical NTP hydrolase)
MTEVKDLTVHEVKAPPIVSELEQPLDISGIDHAEMVRTLAKPGAVIAVELTSTDISILTVISELCKKSGFILAHIAENISLPISDEEAHLWHMAIGMTGEAGELLDAYKKLGIYRKELDLVNVIEELGDFEFYLTGYKQGTMQEETEFDYRLAQLYELFSITRQEVIEGNIRKLAKRYNGLKYSDQAAQDRADKA